MRYLILVLIIVGVLFAAGPGRGLAAEAQWWLFNAEPPEVSISAPSNVLRSEARFIVRVRAPEHASVVAAWVDTTPLEPSEELVVDTTRLSDGAHRVVVEARDRSRQRNATQQAVSFVTDNSPPALQVELEPPTPAEGRVLLIRVRLSEAGSVTGQLSGRELHFQGAATQRWAVIGIPPEPAYRQVNLRLEVSDAIGNRQVWERRYPLTLTRFPVEQLDVAPELARLLLSEAGAIELARLMPIYNARPGPARWSGRFNHPVDGPITTEFGTRRSYNGRFPSGNHAGTDFAADMGTPVEAPANGRVAFTGQIDLRGNVVVLDHGAGVFSTLAHLSRILVPEGEQVVQGDHIGLVGSTGLSTGPHLHWEIWVTGANVDPLDWAERVIP